MPTNAAFTHRALTREEAETIRKAVRHTPNITGYTTDELIHFPDALVAAVNGEFAGVCISIDLLPSWTDIAMLYVLDEYREQGLGMELLDLAWEAASQRKRDVYMASRNPTVIRDMERRGMRFLPLVALPLAVHFHNLRFILNSYRVKEALRKSSLSKNLPPFRYAIRKIEPH